MQPPPLRHGRLPTILTGDAEVHGLEKDRQTLPVARTLGGTPGMPNLRAGPVPASVNASSSGAEPDWALEDDFTALARRTHTTGTVTAGPAQRKCGRCGESGHDARTCAAPAVEAGTAKGRGRGVGRGLSKGAGTGERGQYSISALFQHTMSTASGTTVPRLHAPAEHMPRAQPSQESGLPANVVDARDLDQLRCALGETRKKRIAIALYFSDGLSSFRRDRSTKAKRNATLIALGAVISAVDDSHEQGSALKVLIRCDDRGGQTIPDVSNQLVRYLFAAERNYESLIMFDCQLILRHLPLDSVTPAQCCARCMLIGAWMLQPDTEWHSKKVSDVQAFDLAVATHVPETRRLLDPIKPEGFGTLFRDLDQLLVLERFVYGKLERHTMDRAFITQEMPIAWLLAQMWLGGIKLNREELLSQQVKLQTKMKGLQEKANTIAQRAGFKGDLNLGTFFLPFSFRRLKKKQTSTSVRVSSM